MTYLVYRSLAGTIPVYLADRKSYMSLRLVPKLVILNDLERLNGCYIALFH